MNLKCFPIQQQTGKGHVLGINLISMNSPGIFCEPQLYMYWSLPLSLALRGRRSCVFKIFFSMSIVMLCTNQITNATWLSLSLLVMVFLSALVIYMTAWLSKWFPGFQAYLLHFISHSITNWRTISCYSAVQKSLYSWQDFTRLLTSFLTRQGNT